MPSLRFFYSFEKSSAIITRMSTRRAIGLVRVSHVGDREGDSFASPGEQRHRLETACERDGLNLVKVYDELDVSGGTPLERRTKGLKPAIESIEAGEAEVLVVPYFDRLVRSLQVQAEIVERVEAAGGQVLALDVGQVTNGTAGQWLSGTMLGAVAEYHRRSTGDRVKAAHIRAVERGAWPGRVPPGYVRHRPDGVLEPDPATRTVVADAIRLRAAGASYREIRTFLAGHGISRSQKGIQTLIESRVVLGHIYFGGLVKLNTHEAIIDAETWRRANQHKGAPRGRQSKSKRLLARLDILTCGTCGSRMIATTTHGGEYASYRCATLNDCPRRAYISAKVIEGLVIEAVKTRTADEEGRASAEAGARTAALDYERAQADLDAGIRAFAGVAEEPAAVERISELVSARDSARERMERLGGNRAALVINTANDWDRLSFDGRRALIQTTIESVTVQSGRGPGRASIKLIGE